jgi:hypothetical protein
MKRLRMALRTSSRPSFPPNIITPTIIMRFVGWSIRNQAVSTPEMRSRGRFTRV